MTDDPFRNRTEDFINSGMKAVVSALPVIGGPVGEFVQYVIGDPAQERRDDFMRDLYVRLERLARDHEEAVADQLRLNVQFQATFIQAAQASARAVQDEKLAMLKNAVLNSAVGTIDENIRLVFMSLIERLTPLHVSLLKLLSAPAANDKARALADRMTMGGLLDVVEVAIPALATNREFASVLAADLEAAKLVNGANLNTTMSSNGLLVSRATPLGMSFLQFFSDPETGQTPV